MLLNNNLYVQTDDDSLCAVYVIQSLHEQNGWNGKYWSAYIATEWLCNKSDDWAKK